ncbi:MAG: putative lipid II flippase FtsW [bacterium]|nr:putative lipid II flippase FtsW [bacterium]
MSPTSAPKKIDKFFLISVGVLTCVGFVIFLSASLGLLAENGSNFNTIALKQTISLGIGLVAFYIFSRMPYQKIKDTAFYVFLGAIAINLLLFIPGLSLHHGGASRWIDFGFISFQPSEFLKIAFIIYFAAWLHFAKDKIKNIRFGLIPYVILMGILSVLLFSQNDLDTLVVIGFTGLVMMIIAGLPIKHTIAVMLVMAVALSGLVALKPDRLERIKTYLNPSADVQGKGYQINQSLIAIGSGQITGRGFGQSVQKFGYLPEPIGDSIFAVAAEEFGFIGSLVLLSLYIMLAISSFRIGTRATDVFGGLVAIGIAVLIITESFMNMAAMLGIIPLSGMPLLFISHGGTALIIILAATGIVANISKHAKG